MGVEALTIRVAGEDDISAILALYAAAGFVGAGPLDEVAARDKLRRIAAYPDYRIFVLAVDGSVVGTYALLVMDNIAHGGAPLSIVEQVAVAPGRQGQGLGTAMMEHAMAESRARGCYKLQLSSNVKFERAHAFYDKLGFTRHGYSFVVDL